LGCRILLWKAQQLRTGSIVRSVRDHGFGFIRTVTGQGVFVRATGVTGTARNDSPNEGQSVCQGAEPDTRGRSERVVPVRPAQPPPGEW
jgi:cold shock CspA family protein